MKEHITTEKLSEYIDGFSDSSEKSRIESHLSLCSQCRSELESLKKMLTRMSGMKTLAIKNTEQFVSLTMSKIRRHRKAKILRHAMMPAAAAAVVLVVVGFGFFEDHRHAASLKTASQSVSHDAAEFTAVDYEDVVGASASVRSIVATLQKNHATVTKKTDDYIEATVSLEDYQKIRSTFGFTQLPAGFVGNGLDLAAVGDNSQRVAPAYDQDQVRIRIRRR
jgi:hypothetical protein